MSVEAGVYLVTTYFVTRNRPAVPRLEQLIVSDSYPSGHVAAAVALYGALAIVVWSLTTSRVWRAIFARARDPGAALRGHVTGIPRHAQPDRRDLRRADRCGVHRRRIPLGPGRDGRSARAPHRAGAATIALPRGGGVDDIGRRRRPRAARARWWADRSCGACCRDAGSTTRCGSRCRRAGRRRSGSVEALDDGAELIFVWGGDGMVQRCSTRSAATGAPLAIVPAGTGNLLATTSASRSTSPRASRSGSHGARRAHRRRPRQRGAVRGHGGRRLRRADDPRRRPAPQGPLRRARLHVDRGEAPAAAAVRGARSRSTATRGSTAKVGCVLVGNVGKLFGGVRCSTTPARRRSARGRRRHGEERRRNGRARSCAPRSASAERSTVRADTRAKRIRIELDREMPYELDGGDRPPTDRLKIGSSRRRCSICVPEEAA